MIIVLDKYLFNDQWVFKKTEIKLLKKQVEWKNVKTKIG
jgi:hypothetical protein